MSTIRKYTTILIAGISMLLLQYSVPASAQSGDDEPRASVSLKSSKRSPGLETPASLRPRVNFWVDIFTKYGKYQLIVHHRRFPQIVFKVLDFSKAAQNLNPVQLANLKKRIEKEKVEEVQGYLTNLARTGRPSNGIEEYIVRQMSGIPGGTAKYQAVLDNDWVRTQTGIKEKYAEAVRRTGRYLHHIERIFVNENALPVELTRLPFIESSFDYTAYSSVGAAGIWQFMRGTAKKYMTVNNFVDERLDPIIATRGAAQYLKSAYKSLGAWPLAVTSYNHGVTGVYRKMKEQGTMDLARVIEKTSGDPVFGFASTNFYPEFLAAVEIYENYQAHFPGLALAAPMEGRDYRVPRPVYIHQVARTLGVEKEDLLAANYALLPPVATGKRLIPAGYTLRIPNSVKAEVQKLDTIESPHIEIKPTPASKLLKPPASKKVPSKPATIKANKPKPQSGRVHTVRSGETLSTISKTYGVSVDKLRSLNKLKTGTIKAGQKLRLS